MNAAGIVGLSYLAMFLVTARLVGRHMAEDNDDLEDKFLNGLMSVMVAIVWPFLLLGVWAVYDIPTVGTMRARRKARIARQLAEAEQELADATRALERAQGKPYDDLVRRYHR